ncbi:CoA-binding protein [Actinomadura sp.]|jgi:acyl-CoA synthetase (NDP forming)|uniref:CoA-binding protein n=1 Tax=Actinomadura sp. TaxID=1989 RepID=UPI00334678A6
MAELSGGVRARVVAVIGASHEGGTVLDGLLRGGFDGSVYAVNPHCAGNGAGGVRCVATLADLPEPPDLAVIAVPAYAVPGVAGACGRSGVPAVAVAGAELSDEQERGLLAACREHGMRLVGLDGLGA